MIAAVVGKISNHPNDTNRMQLRTPQTKNGMLAFGQEIAQFKQVYNMFATAYCRAITP